MNLDIAPFARQEQSKDETQTTYRWEEPRDIHQVILTFPPGAVLPDKVRLDYWRRYWPQQRATAADMAAGSIGRAGWKPRDDWFNGEWAHAHIRTRRRGHSILCRFAPLASREFRDLTDFSVTYRQTLQLRISLPPAAARPESVQVLTDTPMEAREIAVQLGCGRDEPTMATQVHVYNGVLAHSIPPSAGDPRLHLRVLCACPGPLSYDRTIVTVAAPPAAFSFLTDDLSTNRPIWAPDLGVLVSLAADNLRHGPDLLPRLSAGTTVYDRIPTLPEQTLDRAKRNLPPKRPMHFIVGCEGRRQKFGVDPNGDIFAREGFVRRVPGPDTPRLLWKGREFRLRFHWDGFTPNGRFVEEGSLPILRSTYSRGSLDITQEVFATVLHGQLLPIRGEDPVVAMVQLTFQNRGDSSLALNQPFSFHSGDPQQAETLSLQGGRVTCTGTPEFLRAVVEHEPSGQLHCSGSSLRYSADLPPAACHRIAIKVPFIAPSNPGEIAQLDALQFSQQRHEVRHYWNHRFQAGARLRSGDPDIDDFYRAHLTHVLINDDHEPGSDRIMGRVSSFSYGNFSNESIMQIMDLDRRGIHDEARRHLETYVHYQSTVGLPGNFQSKQGVFYGSGGYEHGDYNQHHGWVLWGMAEHYRFTGDRAWLLRVADPLIAGCDWVTRERQATMKKDAAGEPVPEYGFLPAGSLEDVRDYYYWLSTNALTCRGIFAAAEALADAGHPEGPRLVREANAFLEDLRRGFERSRTLAPLVRLRDGTFVPSYPSRLYWRGRDFGWIREVLEGSIILTTTVLDPNSAPSTWILKDYEDNRYLDAPYNYPLDNFEAQWFDRGGFSFQPNLLYFPPPYLFRDQIEHFLRAFFNGFAACWRQELRAMTEHPLPTLADWAGDHFKSSDEAMVTYWLRLMFIQEDREDLYLGRGIPRAWFAGGGPIYLRNAATHFGPMSVQLETSEDRQRMTATVDPPRRKSPRRIFLRFRHPERMRLVSADVNGTPWGDFSPEKEWVVLPGMAEPFTVVGLFAPP